MGPTYLALLTCLVSPLTPACAAAVSGAVLNLNERCVDIEFPEGILNINWKSNNNIYMTGKVSEIKKISVNV